MFIGKYAGGFVFPDVLKKRSKMFAKKKVVCVAKTESSSLRMTEPNIQTNREEEGVVLSVAKLLRYING